MMKPRVISAGITKETPFAFDFGWKRLLACGCFSTVLIIDPMNARCVQSLQGHRSTISLVSWAPENYYHDFCTPYFLRLATVDISGTIIVWDAVKAMVHAEFSEPGCTVLALSWIADQTVSKDLLLVLHSKGHCILWNVQTQTQLWKTYVDDNITSFSLDPFRKKHVLFFGPNSLKIVNDFSISAPFTFKSSNLMSGKYNETAGSSIHPASSTKRPTSPANRESNFPFWSGSPSSPQTIPHAECIQVCYHQHRTRCAILLFKRHLTIVDLNLLCPVVSVRLNRGQAPFLRVYSCQQRDVLICLHENGCISIYARSGLVSSLESTPRAGPESEYPDLDPVGELAPYDLVAQTEGSRRSNRQSLKLRFSVDRSREVNIAVVASEGRIHFWQLRQVPLQPASGCAAGTAIYPSWTLKDIVPHAPGSADLPKLYLQLVSMYTASRANVTTCRVCPQHLLKPLATQLGCHALVAVGNSRGMVQIWDMLSGMLWREVELLPVPILGVEWLTVPQNLDYPPEVDEVYGDSSIPASSQPSCHLGLVVYGWQAKDRASTASSPEESQLDGSNHISLLNLSTGLIENFRSGSPSIVTGFKASGKASRGIPNKADTVSEGPIELARMSHLGQYLALLIRNECVELWNMVSLKLIKRISFDPGSYGVTLDWYQSVIRVSDVGPTRPVEMLPISPDSKTSHDQSPSDVKSSTSKLRSVVYQRESFIMCRHPLALRLIVVEGDKTDTTVVSNTILQGLPPFTADRVSAVAWFADLIAFGTADGFIAVRDLHAKKTSVRMTSSLGWLNVTEPLAAGVPPDSTLADVRSILCSIVSVNRYSTGVRRLAFLPGSSTASRLLAVLYDSIYLWEPREMTLICTARFDGRLQRCLISADWAYPISSLSDPAFCLVVGADGALRLAEAGGGGMEMIPVTNSSSSGVDQPTTRFIGSSPMIAQLDDVAPLLNPSVLPIITALIIRHLLQHQPWRSSKHPPATDDHPLQERENLKTPCLYNFSCPKFATGFAKVESSVRQFLQSLQERPECRKSFLNPSATIVERCLWTAQLFDDAYEIKFWSLVASRLLPDACGRYVLDQSWGLLADSELYREAEIIHVKLMEHVRSSSRDLDRCVHQLVLLGLHDRAVSLLLETSPDSSNYTVDMLRACLLASHTTAAPSTPIMHSSPLAEDTHLSTVKLVATNFLSCGQIDRGIELLCLIGMWTDACRYLESFDEWKRALWLAKCTLPRKGISNVFRRWAVHLSSQQNNYKDFAVLVYVWLDEHDQALGLLYELGQHQLAARYLEACFEANVLNPRGENADLYKKIFAEFTKILLKLGHYESARYYCDLSGKYGDALDKDVHALIT